MGDVRHSGMAIFVAAALGLAACGSGGPSKSATTTPAPTGRQIVLASVVKTAAADSAKVSLDMSFSGFGRGLSVSADGAIDFASGASQTNMTFDGPFASFLTGGIETRTVDGVVYVRMPVGLLSGKQWIAVDTKRFGATGRGSGDTALGIGSQSDPTKILAYLGKVSNGVQLVGTETIRGVETTHYRATVDLTKAADAAELPPSLRAAVGRLSSKVGDIPVDVWIDADGLLRREKLGMSLGSFLPAASGASGSTGGSATVTVQLDLYDFGAPVHVQAPPPDQVATLANGGFAGGGAIRSNTTS